MAQTIIGVNSPRAVRRWGAGLLVDVNAKSYFSNRFIGDGDDSVIQRRKELETDAGDVVQFDLSVQLKEQPTEGDDRLDGKAENLRFYTDEVRIDQIRKAASAGGKMTRKRTIHDLRSVARARLAEYFARWDDEQKFMYLSGARGINADFAAPIGYTGRAGNPIQAPDADHIIYGGTAVSKASLTSADKMSRNVIERVQVKATMMRAQAPESANMMPVSVGGEGRYVTLMSPYQAFDLRNTDTTGWLDMQKAAAASEGRSNPIFKGGLGLLNNTVLHEHLSTVRFSDYGSGLNLPAARALFMGRQAGIVAYGTSAQGTYSWHEELKDHGNLLEISAGTISGFKKARFNDRDFGVIAIDTYALAVA